MFSIFQNTEFQVFNSVLKELTLPETILAETKKLNKKQLDS